MSEPVVVAMSGGVDSSVAAALLARSGADVVGVTLQLWPKGAADLDRHHGCCSLDAVEDARRVAAHVGIPHYVLDVEREFGERVIDPFVRDYTLGLTPNPCISCNTSVKFDLLLDKARAMGADRLATGHYARVTVDDDGRRRLRRAADGRKDQSYVLYGLGQEELGRAVFPLGEMAKPEVRELARELGLLTWDKPDSVEICFVTDGDYRDVVARRAGAGGGEIRHVDGAVLGRHAGVWGYTVGQRSGLGRLPRGMTGPLYVVDLDPATQTVTVGPREALARREVRVGELSFVGGRAPGAEFEAEVQARYGAAPVAASVRLEGAGAVVVPAEPLAVATPGQAAVFYAGDEVLGGGRVLRAAVAARS